MSNIEVGALCAILAMIVAYAGYRLSSRKESKTEGQELGTVLSELGYIKSNTDEIKQEQKEQRKTNTEFYTRLASVEASAKQAHKRLDRLEGREERD